MTSANAVEQHYSGRGLAERIFTALAEKGHDTDRLTPDLLAPYDEFHVGGMAATRRLAGRLALDGSTHLLDVGCGAGGPARAVAAEIGCQVTGIDLTADFITAGTELTARCGLSELVTLRQASALDMPFEDASFSHAMMLHVGMNITDKTALLAEVARILAPGGMFVIYDMMQVGDGTVTFPMPWASSADVSAVASPDDYIAAAQATGLTLAAQYDETEAAEGFFKHVLATKPPAEPGKAPDPFRNLATHIEAGILAPTELFLRKDG